MDVAQLSESQQLIWERIAGAKFVAEFYFWQAIRPWRFTWSTAARWTLIFFEGSP